MDMITDAEIRGDSGGGRKIWIHAAALSCPAPDARRRFFTGHIKPLGQDGLKAFFADKIWNTSRGIGDDGESLEKRSHGRSQLKGGTGIEGNSVFLMNRKEAKLDFSFSSRCSETRKEGCIILHFMNGDGSAVHSL